MEQGKIEQSLLIDKEKLFKTKIQLTLKRKNTRSTRDDVIYIVIPFMFLNLKSLTIPLKVMTRNATNGWLLVIHIRIFGLLVGRIKGRKRNNTLDMDSSVRLTSASGPYMGVWKELPRVWCIEIIYYDLRQRFGDGKSATQTIQSSHHNSMSKNILPQRPFSEPPKIPLARLRPHEGQKSPLSEPALKVVSINIEGFSEDKKVSWDPLTTFFPGIRISNSTH